MIGAKRQLRVGVIGLGVGEQHIVGYQEAFDAEVIAICDLNPEHLSLVAQRRNIAQTFTDWRRVTEHPDIDIVSICSYDDGHAEQCLSALLNGKHVMVEKPICLFRHEQEALIRAHADSGRILTSNLILRQSPRFQNLRRQVADRLFGDIFYVEGGYIHDILWKITSGWRGKLPFYSTVFGGGIHLIDLMRWILNDEVVEVSGMSNKILTRGSDYAFDDTFVNLLRFEGGALGRCLSTFGPARTKFHELNIYGSRMTFLNDMPNGKVFVGDHAKDERRCKVPYPGIGKHELIPDFVDAVREGREPQVGYKDVFRVMDICFSCVEAAATGRSVKVSYSV